MDKTLNTLRDEREGLLAEVKAIYQLAETENREVSDDEITRIDAIQGKGETAGLVQKIDDKIDRLEKTHQLAAKIAKERFKESAVESPVNEDGEFDIVKMKLPAKAKRGNFKSFAGADAAKEAYIAGRFYDAVVRKSEDSREWLASHGLCPQMAHSGETNSAGGYTVPELLESNLIRLVEEYGVARRSCRVVQMPGPVMNWPRRATGFTGYFVGENSAPTASDMSFDQIRLEAKNYKILTSFSSEIGEDSLIDLGDLFTQEFAYNIANKEDNCLFVGDGSSTYGGILGLKNALAAGCFQTDGANDDTFAETVIAEFHSAMGKLPMYPGIQPKWYVHSSGWHNVMVRLAQAAGGTNPQDYQGLVGPNFLGYPVVFTQVLPSGVATTDLSDSKWCYFGDLSMGVTMGVRRGITMATSAEYGFNTDSIYVRCTTRFDINVHERGTASAAGPIVGLVMGS